VINNGLNTFNSGAQNYGSLSAQFFQTMTFTFCWSGLFFWRLLQLIQGPQKPPLDLEKLWVLQKHFLQAGCISCHLTLLKYRRCRMLQKLVEFHKLVDANGDKRCHQQQKFRTNFNCFSRKYSYPWRGIGLFGHIR